MAARVVWEDEAVWPNFSQTARMLEIDRSTLSKQARSGHIVFVTRGLGRGERLVPPEEVLRIALLYRKVPLPEVRKRMAHLTAKRTSLSEQALLSSLEQFQASALGPIAAAKREEENMAQPPIKENEAVIGSQVVDLGRLKPRRVAENEVPDPSLLAALDSRTLREPQFQIVSQKPRVVHLGRLHPGIRT